MVLRHETLYVLYDHFALNLWQAIDALHVVAHAVESLPACHGIRSDARMRCAEGGSDVFGSAPRAFPHAIFDESKARGQEA